MDLSFPVLSSTNDVAVNVLDHISLYTLLFIHTEKQKDHSAKFLRSSNFKAAFHRKGESGVLLVLCHDQFIPFAGHILLTKYYERH